MDWTATGRPHSPEPQCRHTSQHSPVGHGLEHVSVRGGQCIPAMPNVVEVSHPHGLENFAPFVTGPGYRASSRNATEEQRLTILSSPFHDRNNGPPAPKLFGRSPPLCTTARIGSFLGTTSVPELRPRERCWRAIFPPHLLSRHNLWDSGIPSCHPGCRCRSVVPAKSPSIGRTGGDLPSEVLEKAEFAVGTAARHAAGAGPEGPAPADVSGAVRRWRIPRQRRRA